MVKVTAGDTIKAGKLMRSGNGAKGPWAFIPVKAERGYDTITVWAANPADITGAGAVRITEIRDVAITNQKKEGPEGTKWYTNYSVTAKLERVEGHANGDEWVTAEDDLEDIFKL